jgi:hypothetical protein
MYKFLAHGPVFIKFGVQTCFFQTRFCGTVSNAEMFVTVL